MDHENIFQRKNLSDLIKNPAEYYAEWIQGRCVAVSEHDHDHDHIDSVERFPLEMRNMAKSTELDKHRKECLALTSTNVDAESFVKTVIGNLGSSVEAFMESGLFWGVTKESEQQSSLESCLKALDDRWDTGLEQAESCHLLRWYIKLGHERVEHGLRNMAPDDRPQDFQRISALLATWEPIQCPDGLIQRDELLGYVCSKIIASPTSVDDNGNTPEKRDTDNPILIN